MATVTAGDENRELPIDEREAAEMLREGILDSALWDILEPFYRQPLSVPLGELVYLAAAVDRVPQNVPITARRLSRYRPWTREKVELFFSDWPELRPFRPILSFDDGRRPHWGLLGFRLIKRELGRQSGASVRFSVFPHERVSGQGAFTIDSTLARWRRRRMNFSIPRAGEIGLGNFAVNFGEGLVYGYFPRDTRSTDDPVDNWAYGRNASWNGFLWEKPWTGRLRTSAVLHARPTEAVLGLISRVKYARKGTGYFGISALENRQSGDTAVHAHAGVEQSLGEWTLAVHAAAGYSNPLAVPVEVRLRRGRGAGRFDSRFVYVPAGFHGPRSRTLRDFRTRLDEDDSTVERTVKGLDLSFNHLLGDLVNVRPSVSYIAGETSYYLQTALLLDGTAAVNYSLRYAFEPATPTVAENHRVGVSVDRRINKKVLLKSGIRGFARTDEYSSLRGRLGADWCVRSYLVLSPFVHLYGNSRGTRSGSVGVVQSLGLFERTRGNVQLEFPFGDTGSEGVALNAAADFMF